MQVALPEPLPQDLKARFPVQMLWTYAFDVDRIQSDVTTCAKQTLLEFRVSCRMKLGC